MQPMGQPSPTNCMLQHPRGHLHSVVVNSTDSFTFCNLGNSVDTVYKPLIASHPHHCDASSDPSRSGGLHGTCSHTPGTRLVAYITAGQASNISICHPSKTITESTASGDSTVMQSLTLPSHGIVWMPYGRLSQTMSLSRRQGQCQANQQPPSPPQPLSLSLSCQYTPTWCYVPVSCEQLVGPGVVDLLHPLPPHISTRQPRPHCQQSLQDSNAWQ